MFHKTCYNNLGVSGFSQNRIIELESFYERGKANSEIRTNIAFQYEWTYIYLF